MKKITKLLSMTAVALTVSASSAMAMCSVDEINRWGDRVSVHTKNTCERALRACERNKRRNSSYCSISRRGGNGGGYNKVERECTVYENGDWGVEDTHTAYARGRRGSGVKAKACDKAMNKCQRKKSYYNYCSEQPNNRRRPPRRPGQGRGQHVETYTFAGYDMADAMRTCQRERRQNLQCSSHRMRCTPCESSRRARASYELYRVRR